MESEARFVDSSNDKLSESLETLISTYNDLEDVELKLIPVINKYVDNKTLCNVDFDVDSSNCWYINPTSNKNHPAVFPKELCRRVLKYYSFIGDVVLDPFAGSGTLGEVAIAMDRIPILCEQNEEYCDLINKDNRYFQL